MQGGTIGPLSIDDWREIWKRIDVMDIPVDHKECLRETIETAVSMNQFSLWFPQHIIKQIEKVLEDIEWQALTK